MHTKCCFRFLFKSVYITYYQSFICSSTQTFNISYYTFSVKQGTTYKRTLSFSIIWKIGTIIVNWKLISNHYVCARVCVCVCCVCVHAPILLHYISAISIYVYICVDTYIHTYIHICIYVHTYIHICTRACMHAYIHTYIHTYIYTHTYVLTHIFI